MPPESNNSFGGDEQISIIVNTGKGIKVLKTHTMAWRQETYFSGVRLETERDKKKKKKKKKTLKLNMTINIAIPVVLALITFVISWQIMFRTFRNWIFCQTRVET